MSCHCGLAKFRVAKSYPGIVECASANGRGVVDVICNISQTHYNLSRGNKKNHYCYRGLGYVFLVTVKFSHI